MISSQHRRQRLGIPAVERNLRAFAREQRGDRGADAARTARHQRDFVLQAIHSSCSQSAAMT
jgi:hypothetical protein